MRLKGSNNARCLLCGSGKGLAARPPVGLVQPELNGREELIEGSDSLLNAPVLRGKEKEWCSRKSVRTAACAFEQSTCSPHLL